MKNLNILLVIDSRYQSGSWWRTTGPFTFLRKQYPEVNFQFRWMPDEEIRWVDVAGSDIVFFHRPYTESHFRVFRLARDYQIPTWLDIDDHLLDIPHDNATHAIYMDSKIHDHIVKMIFGANVVTVSTNEMKRQYDKFRPKKDCLILKNAFNENLWSYRNPNERSDTKRVLWRGSHHHQKDLLENKDAIIKACLAFPKFEFYFVGWKPWYIIEKVENAYFVTPMEVNEFHKCLHSIHPDVVMVPLADNTFNRCKSNIAAIEGAMACGMILAPYWEEWKMPGVLTYTNDFEKNLIDACYLAKHDNHENAMDATWEHVKEKFALKDWNHKRMMIIDYLIGDDRNLTVDELIREDSRLVYGDTPAPV